RLRKITTYYYDSRIPLTKIAFPGVDEGRHKPRVFEHVYDDAIAVEPVDEDGHEPRVFQHVYDDAVPLPTFTDLPTQVTTYECDDLEPLDTVTGPDPRQRAGRRRDCG
ncbi:MAG: hypothetical protein HUU20_22720, partial [Pirellulales bacterium]|nr:hypothetical protein [Pirellulales bacterium]